MSLLDLAKNINMSNKHVLPFPFLKPWNLIEIFQCLYCQDYSRKKNNTLMTMMMMMMTMMMMSMMITWPDGKQAVAGCFS